MEREVMEENLGAKGSLSGHYNRTKTNIFGGGYSSKKGLYNSSEQQATYDNLSSGWSVGTLVGFGREYYPSSGTYIPKQYDGQLKSLQVSIPLYGDLTHDFDTSGNLLETTHSWVLVQTLKYYYLVCILILILDIKI